MKTEKVATKLEVLRLSCSISQTDLAFRSGISQQRISQYESFDSIPTMDELQKFADVLSENDPRSLLNVVKITHEKIGDGPEPRPSKADRHVERMLERQKQRRMQFERQRQKLAQIKEELVSVEARLAAN